jgi:4a-hydroxytetrahydrobiopterin dehydratase
MQSLLSREQVQASLRTVSGWKVSRGKAIAKKYRFRNFKQAMRFVNRIAKLAEKMQHHPDIGLQNYNEVVLSSTTHDEGGVTECDFKLAKAIDRIRK